MSRRDVLVQIGFLLASAGGILGAWALIVRRAHVRRGPRDRT